jgi:hypothetical protein
MSITFNWSISKTQVNPVQDGKTNVVTKVEWFVTAIDENNNSTSSTGTCNLSLADTFTPFEDLTEQQVLGWCFASENFKANTEKQLTEQIALQLTQKQTEPTLPWVQVARF